MRVAIVGGSGSFGLRLGRMLREDGHEVVVVGRSDRSADTARREGQLFVKVDISGDLAPLFDSRPEIVVDAAGPFQHYGGDRYRLARACIGSGCHYLDLSDDGHFTAGIAELDELARNAGVAVISGASSVPAISSAAVVHLASGLDRLLAIESAIMPGNRAPRGRSVVASILSQAGRTMPGCPSFNAWTDPRTYRLGEGIVRRAWRIGAPDLQLFPVAFACSDVSFRAGMESTLLNKAVSFYGLLARRGLAPDPRRFSGLASFLSGVTLPFGTDVGGMIVDVTGTTADGIRRLRWTLLARNGDGPSVPGLPVRALLRRGIFNPGARPCIAEIKLAEIEASTSGLQIETHVRELPCTSPYQQAAGDGWHGVPEAVKSLHAFHGSSAQFAGTADIERGRGIFANIVAWVFGLPAEGRRVPVTVTKIRDDGSETWSRNFGGHGFSSTISADQPGSAVEAFGPFRFKLAVEAGHEGMSLDVISGTAFGMPMPRFLLPTTCAFETSDEGVFRFDVTLDLPRPFGRIVRYRGRLRAVGDGCP